MFQRTLEKLSAKSLSETMVSMLSLELTVRDHDIQKHSKLGAVSIHGSSEDKPSCHRNRF
jgi:hypothetical protein